MSSGIRSGVAAAVSAFMAFVSVNSAFAQEASKENPAGAEKPASPPPPPPSDIPASQIYEDSPESDHKPFELFQTNPHKWVGSFGGGGFAVTEKKPRESLTGGTFQLALGRSWDFFDLEGDFGFGDAGPEFDGLLSAAVRGRVYPITRPKMGLLTIGPYIAVGGGAGIEFGEIHGTGGPENLLFGDISVGAEAGVKSGTSGLLLLFFDVGYSGVRASGKDLPLYLTGWRSARCGRGGVRFRF